MRERATDAARQIEFYRQMVRIRLFEEKTDWLFGRGYMRGTFHSCIGQEAAAVGACSAAGKDDFVTSTHRGHGHAIAKGLCLKKLMAEMAGKNTGYCGGRGGSQHLASIQRGFFTNGITGGTVPIAAGLALSFKLSRVEKIVLCFFGDGAFNAGHVHEALNVSSLWKLPVLFICENNRYAMSTSTVESMVVQNIAERALSYGMPAVSIDGNDVQAVFQTVESHAQDVRSAKGPAFIECRTYRQRGHSKNDPCRYRDRAEEAYWRKRDPIRLAKEKILSCGILSEGELVRIEESAANEVESAARFALDSPLPDKDTLKDHLFV